MNSQFTFLKDRHSKYVCGVLRWLSGAAFYVWLSMVLSDENILHINKVFTRWLIPCTAIYLKNRALLFRTKAQHQALWPIGMFIGVTIVNQTEGINFQTDPLWLRILFSRWEWKFYRSDDIFISNSPFKQDIHLCSAHVFACWLHKAIQAET